MRTSKWGRCRKCIQANLLIAVIGWTAFGVLHAMKLSRYAWSILPLAVFGSLFSLVHAIAYYGKPFTRR